MKNKTTLLLIVFLCIALFLRLYRIGDFLVFLGDEGRDALVVKGILDGHLTLLGPRASAGDFFTGPIYYYMMAPFLWLFQLDPVGPAVMVALFGTATVYLLYVVGKRFFNTTTGLIAAGLYAISPLVIIYSRSSWNPNTVPFFSLLTLYLFYNAMVQKQGWKSFLAVGLLLGICVQLHYIALFLGVIVAVSLLLLHRNIYKKFHLSQIIIQYLQIFLGFLIGFSPFLAFEFRHGFTNLKAIFAFITTDTVQKGYQTYHTFTQPIMDVFFRTFGRLVFNYPVPAESKMFHPLVLELFGGFVVVCALSAIIFLWRAKNKNAVILLLTWLILGVFLFGFYKKAIYDYYLVFLFPLPFLLIGNLVSQVALLGKKKFHAGLIVSSVLVLFLVVYNVIGLPLSAANGQRDQVKHIAEFVLSKTDNKPFNFALLTPGNSDHAYRYYFDLNKRLPVTIENTINDPKRKTVTDQLLIVCEDIHCAPLGNSLFEVAGFGRGEIAGEWDVSVVKVYRLVHYKP